MWILILFSSFVIIAYAVLVGSPNYWFHLLGPAAIAMVVVISLVVLADLSYPFSGEVAISSDAFKSGVLQRSFRPRPLRRRSTFRQPSHAEPTMWAQSEDTEGF